VSKILVVDDEPQIRKALSVTLRASGHEVDVVGTGEEALTRVAGSHPDAVILDLGLPGIDGIDVIEGLRGWTDVPIVVLSVRGEESDKIAALDAGADDYVTKPFGMGELLARLRVVLRRQQPDTSVASVVTPDFTIDLAARRVTVRRDGADEEVRLTPIEWGLAQRLTTNPGRLITQRQLLTEIWGPGVSDQTQYLRVHMSNLRHKLEPDPSRPRYFHTESGMGYRFEPAPEGATAP
jgi:two-component system KDP operon response regulator KdpE